MLLIWTVLGFFVTVTALSIQVVCIVLQTDPAAIDPTIMPRTEILVFIGAIVFDTAYLEWKGQVNIAVAVGLFLIGSAGSILSLQFAGTLVDAFFPKTYVHGFLLVDFFAIALGGLLLPIFGLSPKRGKPVPTDFAGQSSG